MFEEQYRRDNQRLHAPKELLMDIQREAGAGAGRARTRERLTRWGAVAAAFVLVAGGALGVALRNGAKSASVAEAAPMAASAQAADGTQTASTAGDYSQLYELIESMTGQSAWDLAGVTAEATVEAPAMEAGAETDGASSNTAASSADRGAGGDYSATNVQVSGVDEADVVKTDGEYIYYLSGDQLVILRADGADTQVVSKTGYMPENTWGWGSEMFVSGNRLIVFCGGSATVWADGGRGAEQDNTSSVVFDITDRAHPQKLFTLGQSGSYVSSRLIGDYVYLVTTQYVWQYARETPATYVPWLSAGGAPETISPGSISILDHADSPVYTVVSAFDLQKGVKQASSSAAFGSAGDVYCSGDRLLVACPDNRQQVSPIAPDATGKNVQVTVSSSRTRLLLYALNGGEVSRLAAGEVPGTLVNQFAMDEFDGVFRLVTTVSRWEERIYTDGVDTYEFQDETMNCLYTLDGELKELGKLENLAKDEWVESVRFDGEIAYFVTFRQVDPLFTVDLSDPAKPRLLDYLKIPGFSEYLHKFGEGRLLGIGYEADVETGSTQGVKLTMFDTSDKRKVTEKTTLLADASWSSAGSNHKSILIDQERGLIAFPADNGYHIFRYSEQEGFTELAKVDMQANMWYGDIRGLFIGDCFYVLGDESILVFSMSDFTSLAKLKL